MKRLVFEASAFRDWSAIYCQTGYIDWVTEFRKQFNWGLSDMCFVWDGKITTLYRAPEEHLSGLLRMCLEKTKKNPNFFKKIAKEAYDEAKEFEKYANGIEGTDFEKIPSKEFLSIFKEFMQKVTKVAPKVLISLYVPQAFDRISSDEEKAKFESDIKALIQTRDKIDYIVAPIGNKITEIMSNAIMTRLGIDKKLSRLISIEEVEEILKKKNVTRKDESSLLKKLDSRKNYFLEAGGKILTVPLKQYLNKHGWELKEESISKDMVKGTSAYKIPGKITGTVKVIMNKRELNKMNKGDILIAPMTTPEYTSIIKKAKAIITEEGGVTCHAAIIARELKIPTIIGTKTATKVFKDNDKVEIDTEKGVVKRIK